MNNNNKKKNTANRMNDEIIVFMHAQMTVLIKSVDYNNSIQLLRMTATNSTQTIIVHDIVFFFSFFGVVCW